MSLPSKFFFLINLVFIFGCQEQQEVPDLTVTEISKPTEAIEQKASNSIVRSKPVRYRIKEGHVSYTYSGIQRGTEEMYFSDYGMLEIKFTETVRDNPFSGSEEKISLITFMRDSAIYVVDKTTMNARKIDNSLLFETAQESASLDLNEVAENMYRDRGGFIETQEEIAGVQCDRWYIESTKTKEWRHKGIMLNTLVDLPRNFVKVEATAIDTISALPEGIFELPENVNIQDGMSMKRWIEELSKPVERRKVFDIRNQESN